MLQWLKENQHWVNAKWVKKGSDQADFLIVNNQWGFELKETFTNPELYLQEQAKAGVVHSLVSPVPQLFLYEFPEEITCEASDVYNRALAQWMGHHPKRLSALATIPLNNPLKAATELRNAMSLGLKGAIIGPGLPNVMLTEEFFTPFWEEADHLKAIIFIHPLLCEDPRLKKRMMPNLIGVPWETTVCVTDLLLSGLLDKYTNVKIVLAHGGGFLPYQIGRLNKGYEKWPVVSAALQTPPIEYLRSFWYDSVLWMDASLQYLIEMVGEERIVPGYDFPFDLCDWPPACLNNNGVQSLLGDDDHLQEPHR
jgi:aminocarboxymuconate-semialdehyde decarboxylase